MNSGKTVLVADDQDEIVQLVECFLALEGYTAICRDSGEEALIAGRRQHVDLLITDVYMGPGMNGCDLAVAMRAIQPGIKVLYMSGYAEDGRVSEETERGLAVFLGKPFSRKALIGAVEKAFSSTMPASVSA